MSSLAVSLLLLVVVAIALVMLYNMRQSVQPRVREALRRLLPRSMGGEAPGSEASRNSARSPQPARNAARTGDRGEPRLSESTPREQVEGGATPVRGVPVPLEDPAQAVEPQYGPSSAADIGQPDPARFDEPTARTRADTADSARGSAPGSAQPEAPPISPPAGSAPKDTAIVGALHGGKAPASPATGAARPPAVPAVGSIAGSIAGSSAGSSAEATSGSVGVSHLSEVCDGIVELTLASGWSGERLIPIAQRFRRAGSKPVSIEGLSRLAPGADTWHVPIAGRAYDRLRIGVLLANRHGPLNAMEFSEFATGVQALAETLSATVSLPAMGTVLARARDLDATCAQLDAQICINVDAAEAIEPAQLAALTTAFSIVERGSHRYVRPGPYGEAVFSVALAEAPNRVTFLLDVPRSSPALEPWAQMVECASACAKRLGARLADDGGRELTPPALAQIARQLEQRYDSLDAIGLPAGSPLALKVFN